MALSEDAKKQALEAARGMAAQQEMKHVPEAELVTGEAGKHNLPSGKALEMLHSNPAPSPSPTPEPTQAPTPEPGG